LLVLGIYVLLVEKRFEFYFQLKKMAPPLSVFFLAGPLEGKGKGSLSAKNLNPFPKENAI
jgi:hypothetical protein